MPPRPRSTLPSHRICELILLVGFLGLAFFSVAMSSSLSSSLSSSFDRLLKNSGMFSSAVEANSGGAESEKTASPLNFRGDFRVGAGAEGLLVSVDQEGPAVVWAAVKDLNSLQISRPSGGDDRFLLSIVPAEQLQQSLSLRDQSIGEGGHGFLFQRNLMVNQGIFFFSLSRTEGKVIIRGKFEGTSFSRSMLKSKMKDHYVVLAILSKDIFTIKHN